MKTLTLTSVMFILCFSLCDKKEAEPDVLRTIDLTDPNYSILATQGNGMIIYPESIILFHLYGSTDVFVAAKSSCPNCSAGLSFYFKNSYGDPDRFFCYSCQSAYTVAGEPFWGPATAGLKMYKTSLSGNILTIFK